MDDSQRKDRVLSGRIKKIKSFECAEVEEEVATIDRPQSQPQAQAKDTKPCKVDVKKKPCKDIQKNVKNVGPVLKDEKVIQTYTKPQKLPNIQAMNMEENAPPLTGRRYTPTYAPVCMQGPPTPQIKAIYHRQVMEGERARAAAYRKAVGRRNALDFGMKQNNQNGRRTKIKVGKQRCKSVMEKTHTSDEAHQEKRAQSSMAEFVDSQIERIFQNQAEKYKTTGLTRGQIRAFREVFDLFDRNGGGTIDAEELNETLQSVGIMLTREEILEVLQVIDKDGNGEIDFEEFLQLMTNTERFLEAITTRGEGEHKEETGHNQETLLFEALTEFMKKSALHSMDEIVDYFSHKYKKTQTPHVVNHYAAGARLIGLTERQLKEHLEHLKASRVVTGTNNKFLKNSPYAMPLHIITSSTNLPRISSPPKPLKPRRQGRIKLFVKISDEDGRGGDGLLCPPPGAGPGSAAGMDGTSSRHIGGKLMTWNDSMKLHHIPLGKRGFGWVSQHTDHIEVHLESEPLKKLVPFHALTAEDLPSIRTNVQAASLSYTKARRRTQLVDNYKHWNALEASLISPQCLQEHFRGTYSIYSLVAKRHLQIN